MIIDTLAAIIILFNGATVSFDNLQAMIEPRIDTIPYTVIDNDTIWQEVEFPVESLDIELKAKYGVGVNELQKVIEDIREIKMNTDRLKDIISRRKRSAERTELSRERKVIEKGILPRLFIEHPDTIEIWTKQHILKPHSKQKKVYRLYNMKQGVR